MAITRGKVLSVNVGLPREFEYNGRPARSAIWKSPVAGRVAARGVNLAGDDQADRRAHGGPDKAVYAYAVEDLGWWAQEIGRPVQYGELGENLTTEGIEVNGALVGERWAVGTTVAFGSPLLLGFFIGYPAALGAGLVAVGAAQGGTYAGSKRALR